MWTREKKRLWHWKKKFSYWKKEGISAIKSEISMFKEQTAVILVWLKVRKSPKWGRIFSHQHKMWPLNLFRYVWIFPDFQTLEFGISSSIVSMLDFFLWFSMDWNVRFKVFKVCKLLKITKNYEILYEIVILNVKILCV